MQMNMKNRQHFLSFILCMALIVAMALFTTGCNGTNTPSSGANTAQQGGSDGQQRDNNGQQDNSSGQQSNDNGQEDITQLGEGNTKFSFVVVDKEGTKTAFEIHTDKETVGEALLELGLIAGEEGQYGLYVKTVNGLTADYEKDGVYWAFYINDEYAVTGVDSTKITEGEYYSFKVE